MSAIIHFVGLVTFVTSASLPPADPHILIPRFDDIIKKENNVIRVPTIAVLPGTDWESTPGPNDTTDYFIGTQNIRIIGSDQYETAIGKLPHLTCCCKKMDGGLSS